MTLKYTENLLTLVLFEVRLTYVVGTLYHKAKGRGFDSL
jgi:hypothetical protein